jgi:cardiolipin synthase
MNDIWPVALNLRADVRLAIGFVLAVGVTIHILLRKREVASAVGWIGLVWFAPILGALTYAMFGVNRVRRRAQRLRPQDGGAPEALVAPAEGLDPDFMALALGIGQITNRSLRAGAVTAIYRNGDEAYPAMLEAIAAAERSIALSSYIFRNDLWGGRFIDALAEAVRRGVAVRVLIDGFGGGWLTSPAYHRLMRHGVTAERFMHSSLPWRMPFLNLRSHKKILVLDGLLGFTGGMNIADENVMATHPKAPVQDVHFRVEGPVVAELMEAFAEDWAFANGEELAGDIWFPDIGTGASTLARMVDSGPDEDLEKVEFAIMEAVATAQSSIAFMTPYFLPDERMITALSLAAMRGVDVDIVIPQQSNHTLVDWATRANIGPMLGDGVRIWLSPPPFHHTKMMTVDGEWCLIGSCNWDIRSFRLNFELCLEVYDRDLAAKLSGIMAENRASKLTRAALEGRSMAVRLRDAGARLMLPYL